MRAIQARGVGLVPQRPRPCQVNLRVEVGGVAPQDGLELRDGGVPLPLLGEGDAEAIPGRGAFGLQVLLFSP